MSEAGTWETYYVVFSEAESFGLWRWLCRRGFSHVEVLWAHPRELAGATLHGFLWLGASSIALRCLWYAGEVETMAENLAARPYTRVLRWRRWVPRELDGHEGWRLGFLSCVGVVKTVLGIRAPGVWRPEGLWRRLLESGAEQVKADA